MALADSITPFSVILVTTFMAFSSSYFALGNSLPASTISASPAISPVSIAPPLSAPPTLSPDITPLFPSPGGSELSPAESSVPLIPSSPSPPNPDAVAASGPGTAFSPTGLLPDSSSDGLNMAVFLSLMVVVFAGIWVNQDLVYAC